MKNTNLKNLLFKHFSLIDVFIMLVDYICVSLFPCLKNAKLTGVCRYGDGGNPFN
mgnify:CR=1 FL=1